MARKNPLDDPPAVSSSEEEEEDIEEDEEEAAPGSSAQVKNKAEESEDEEDEEDDDDDDEEDEDEDEDEEEEEPDPKKGKNHPPGDSRPTSKNPNPPRSGKPNLQQDSDGSETESDSGPIPPSPNVSDFAIKAHAVAKPTGTSLKPKKLTMVTEKPPLKRPAENSNNGDEKDSKTKGKKAKTISVNNENGGGEEGAVTTEKKGLFSRLWSDDDEIALLKGMIDWKSEKGTDPNSDSSNFHDFMKNFVSVDATKNQLMDKVRRLKKKYKTNVGKATDGEDPVISKPHEYKSFLLSKQLWGGVDAANVGKSRRKAKLPENPKNVKDGRKKVEANTENAQPIAKSKEVAVVKKPEEQKTISKGEEMRFPELYPFLSGALKLSSGSPSSMFTDDGIKYYEQNATFIGELKLKELEEECKKQKLAEAEVFVGRTELTRKLGQSMIEVMKSQNSF